MSQWRTASHFMMGVAVRALVLLPAGGAHAADEPGLPALTGGELIQNAISVRLAQSTNDWCEKQRPQLDKVVDDIQRTLHLPPPRLNLLRIAVQGVLQRTLDERAHYLVTDAEKRTKGVAPKQVAKVLISIDDSKSALIRVEQNPLWEGVVQQLLTSDERQRWEAVVAERETYRAQAIAEFILSRIKPLVRLTDAQADKLLPMIAKGAQEYLPDITSWSSDEEGRGMYAGYAQVLILAVPEAQARTVIKAEQWDKWRRAAGEYADNWEWIKQSHDQRVGKGKR